jgi:hypothetical protein
MNWLMRSSGAFREEEEEEGGCGRGEGEDGDGLLRRFFLDFGGIFRTEGKEQK